MTSAVIFDERNGAIVRYFDTIRGANISFTRKYADKGHYTVATWAYYEKTGAIKAAQPITVINILTGKPCEIRLDQVGGSCDPSTERYHCM